MYAIKPTGSLRAVDETMELEGDETLFSEIPDWAYEVAESARKKIDQIYVEDLWRTDELAFIADQLLALEDGDTSALPVSEEQWRAHRTATRAWKFGAANFPDPELRPARPSNS